MFSLLSKLFGLIILSITVGATTQNYTLAFMFFISSITAANIYYTLNIKNELIDFKLKFLNAHNRKY